MRYEDITWHCYLFDQMSTALILTKNINDDNLLSYYKLYFVSTVITIDKHFKVS